MAEVIALKREFIYQTATGPIPLDDPHPEWDAAKVRQFYAANYPDISVAHILPARLEGESIIVEFKSVFGTKG
jgi:PRTRC genetic system protein C